MLLVTIHFPVRCDWEKTEGRNELALFFIRRQLRSLLSFVSWSKRCLSSHFYSKKNLGSMFWNGFQALWRSDRTLIYVKLMAIINPSYLKFNLSVIFYVISSWWKRMFFIHECGACGVWWVSPFLAVVHVVCHFDGLHENLALSPSDELKNFFPPAAFGYGNRGVIWMSSLTFEFINHELTINIFMSIKTLVDCINDSII